MTERVVDEQTLPQASVAPDDSLARAAQELMRSGAGAVAVVDGERRVVGMFTQDDLVRAVFPGYIEDLRHTAFVEDDERLRPHLEHASQTPVSAHMRASETVELPASAIDVAQRFLHTDAPALVATRGGTFAGVIDEAQFCRAILQRYDWDV